MNAMPIRRPLAMQAQNVVPLRTRTPRTSSLAVCGRMEAPGWLVVALVSEWCGAEPPAAGELRRADVQVFAPLVRIRVLQPGRPNGNLRLVPAFPGYLFALPPRPEDWHRIKRTRGVAGVLHMAGNPGRPAEVPPALMGRLLARASKLGVLEDVSVPDVPAGAAPPPLDQGTRCVVTAGLFEGRAGVVERCKGWTVRLVLDGVGIPAVMRRDQVEAAAGA